MGISRSDIVIAFFDEDQGGIRQWNTSGDIGEAAARFPGRARRRRNLRAVTGLWRGFRRGFGRGFRRGFGRGFGNGLLPGLFGFGCLVFCIHGSTVA